MSKKASSTHPLVKEAFPGVISSVHQQILKINREKDALSIKTKKQIDELLDQIRALESATDEAVKVLEARASTLRKEKRTLIEAGKLLRSHMDGQTLQPQ